jgi:hypothetical protein
MWLNRSFSARRTSKTLVRPVLKAQIHSQALKMDRRSPWWISIPSALSFERNLIITRCSTFAFIGWLTFS